MVATANSAPHIDSCRHLLDGQAKNLADRLYGPEGPPPGVRFSDIEKVVKEVGGQLQKKLFDLLLARQAEYLHSNLDEKLRKCPSCGGETLPRDPEPRFMYAFGGIAVEWLEPHRYCKKCRRAYFPMSRLLGIDLSQYSPAALELIVYSGANKISYREAAIDLKKMSNLTISEKQVENLTKRIGRERVAEREAEVERFVNLTLMERCTGAPEGVTPPSDHVVAAIMADAGMLQIRNTPAAPAGTSTAAPLVSDMKSNESAESKTPTTESVAATEIADASGSAENEEDEWDEEEHGPKPSGRHWREDKVGLAMTMSSKVSDTDPCPTIPKNFLDPERVGRIVKGLKKSAALQAEEATAVPGTEAGTEAVNPSASTSSETIFASLNTASSEPATTTEILPAPNGRPFGSDLEEPEREETLEAEAEAEYKGPKLETRQVIASRKRWPMFGILLACTAWMLGFAKAKRKAFVADGCQSIWRVWQDRFSSYTPILDFIHAMSYIYSAAKAVGETAGIAGEGWKLYAQWIQWVWGGEVSKVIAALKEWQRTHGVPDKGESGTSGRTIIAKALVYLQNNESRMQYAEYRKQGLPIMSSLVESMVKQIGRRVKGTEKFWGDEGAEGVLQLRADHLSDGEVIKNFWERRQDRATGQRCYQSRSAA